MKSVLAFVPVYALQALPLPHAVCKDLDAINRNFLRGHGLGKKTYLINWKTITSPIGMGA